MIINQLKEVYLNTPVRVNFAGLRGDTRAMQAQGWEISVEQYRGSDPSYLITTLFGRHKSLDLRFISAPQKFDVDYPTHIEYGGLRMPEVQLRVCAQAINVVYPMARHITAKAVDFSRPLATPFSSFIDQMHSSLDDLVHFVPCGNEEAEIYIPEKEIWTVQKHLDAVVEMQRPKQAELREKARNKKVEIGEQKENVKLKLITF